MTILFIVTENHEKALFNSYYTLKNIDEENVQFVL